MRGNRMGNRVVVTAPARIQPGTASGNGTWGRSTKPTGQSTTGVTTVTGTWERQVEFSAARTGGGCKAGSGKKNGNTIPQPGGGSSTSVRRVGVGVETTRNVLPVSATCGVCRPVYGNEGIERVQRWGW